MPVDRVGVILLICLGSGVGAAAAQEGSDGISGMAVVPLEMLDAASGSEIGSDRWLGGLVLVHDLKSFQDGGRFSVLLVPDGSPPLVEAVATDWGGNEPASDLESICSVPGRPGEYLAAESGYYDGRFGRVFHLTIAPHADGWRARVHTVVQLPHETENVEGIACMDSADGTIVLVSERGDYPRTPLALLRWGLVDLDQPPDLLRLDGNLPFEADPRDLVPREISELYIDPSGDLWVSATVDPGEAGPFRSVVYRAGVAGANPDSPVHLFDEPVPVWRLPGLKVEALGPGLVPGSELSIGTEDEWYGGVWRPLFRRVPSR